jgi:hypothetical protein
LQKPQTAKAADCATPADGANTRGKQRVSIVISNLKFEV